MRPQLWPRRAYSASILDELPLLTFFDGGSSDWLMGSGSFFPLLGLLTRLTTRRGSSFFATAYFTQKRQVGVEVGSLQDVDCFVSQDERVRLGATLRSHNLQLLLHQLLILVLLDHRVHLPEVVGRRTPEHEHVREVLHEVGVRAALRPDFLDVEVLQPD